MIGVGRIGRKFQFRGKTLLGLIFCAAGTMAWVFAGNGARANAQAATPSTAASPATSSQDIIGTWQGTLHIAATGQRPEVNLRLVFKISKADTGVLNASWYSINQSSQGIPMATITFHNGELKLKS